MNRLLKIFCIIFSLSLVSCSNDEKGNSVNKTPVNEPASPQRKIEVRVFRNDTIPGSNLTGFGYDILVDGKRYIHQPHIPAVSGSTGFVTEADAHRTAEYALKKLVETNSLPALSKEELDSLGIKY